jgi:hypothetical protein
MLFCEKFLSELIQTLLCLGGLPCHEVLAWIFTGLGEKIGRKKKSFFFWHVMASGGCSGGLAAYFFVSSSPVRHFFLSSFQLVFIFLD